MLPCSARKITYQNPANPGRVATSRRPAARWLPPILRGHQKCETSDPSLAAIMRSSLCQASPETRTRPDGRFFGLAGYARDDLLAPGMQDNQQRMSEPTCARND